MLGREPLTSAIIDQSMDIYSLFNARNECGGSDTSQNACQKMVERDQSQL